MRGETTGLLQSGLRRGAGISDQVDGLRGVNYVANPEDMWQCQTTNCGYIYNPDKGDRKGKVPKRVKFEDLPNSWKCPVCGAGKKFFKPLGTRET